MSRSILNIWRPNLKRCVRIWSFEEGYGTKFGVGDDRLKGLGVALASRAENLGSSDVVILPKPMAEDLREVKTGGVLWGWPQ